MDGDTRALVDWGGRVVIGGLFSALRRPSTATTMAVAGVVCAAGLWVVDAALEAFVFGLGPFGRRLLSPGDHEGTERILGMALIALVVVLLVPLRERKRRVERALGASQTLYRALVENVEDGVVSVAPNGVVDYASPAAARLVGLTPQQIVGLHFGAFVHPDDSIRVKASFARSMRGSSELTSLRLVGADGMVRQVRTSSRLLVQDGQPVGILAVVTDLTDRREADERLRQLSRAVEASSSVVVITDRSGLITYVNPKFSGVTGYSADEVLGQNPRILKSGEMPPETYREMWDTVAAGREWRGEFYNRRKDGSSYWESASISAVHDEAGEITHFVAVKEDITARKLAEQALVESEEKYRLLFSRQFDAAALVDDRDGRFLEVNDAFLRLFGWSQQELGEMRVETLWVGPNPSVSPPPDRHDSGGLVPAQGQHHLRGGAGRGLLLVARKVRHLHHPARHHRPDSESAPARGAVGHRWPDRAGQPPCIRRSTGEGVAARRADEDPRRPDHGRPRPLQGVQRRLWAPGG